MRPAAPPSRPPPPLKSSVPRDSGSPDATADTTTAPTRPPVTSPPPSPRTPTPSAASKTPAAPRTPRVAPSTPRRHPRVEGPGSLAGRIKPAVRYPGVATAYEAGDGNGACLYGPSGDLMIAAMNHTDYESAKACGAYVLVRAANGASITVRIVNECPLPCAPGQLDLSHAGLRQTRQALRRPAPDHLDAAEPRRVRHDLHPLQGRVQSVLVRHPGDRSPQPVGRAGGQDRQGLAKAAPHRLQLLPLPGRQRMRESDQDHRHLR